MQNISREQYLSNPEKWLLVDVREDFEHEEFNIGGLNMPLSDWPHLWVDLPRDKPVLLYCEKGVRSQIVIQRMEEKGFTNLYNLVDGLKWWRE